MRVISGILKGRIIKGYDIDGTRPTMDRVKESVFASIQENIKDAVVLDLFCGSGNIGIEAISNGAEKCYFVDNNDKATKVVLENVNNFKINNKVKVLTMDYKKSLKYFSLNNIKFDIIFADPPYDYDVIEKIINYVNKYNLLKKDGLLVVEYAKGNLKEEYDLLKLYKSKKYSWKYVNIYKNNS